MSQSATISSTKRELPPLMRLTEAAATRLRHLYATAHAGELLRVSVSTKGCSGKAYDMAFVAQPGEGDEVVKDQGLTLLVDRKATLFLIGSEMDYRESDLEEGFVFINPNEKGRCGCGESFHV
ncbi:HesB/IscA family protein [Acetobacter ghanensis]|uniref:Iron-sulfur cluster assembly accessory protein n=1 Tax=Acetobacter ghanensis TaxID=431306 RepID=A0A0U5F4U5_9PROT|nr:iron-sulfur cluster assembly accessory protein [Acetobacter ghanensis]NHO39241.1 iron-sulfur cluster assembly accessory protein [Acetobacter ghanensis]GBQ45388.1 iron-sulfur cluster assembly protein HesB/YadR/YfhF [Acetobacter ghanensis DSM 18895]CEF56569.1 iron-sulfur cluster assembly accessory protein [Acetobacter ghanensis]